MNTITRWNSLRELDQLQNRLNSWFKWMPLGFTNEEGLTQSEWMPAVDLTEDDKEYLIIVELPDVKKEDIKITVQDNNLTISGERKFEKEEKGKTYHRMERAYGSFMRSFTLPENAQDAKVDAEYKDGVLKLHIPKNQTQKSKPLEVKVR